MVVEVVDEAGKEVQQQEQEEQEQQEQEEMEQRRKESQPLVVRDTVVEVLAKCL